MRQVQQPYFMMDTQNKSLQKKSANIKREDPKGSFCVQEQNQKKFDSATAFKNFKKGLIYPITSIIKHPVESIAIIAGITLSISQFPVLTPILLTVGLGVSAVQLGKGAIEFAKAKNNNEYRKMEKSFMDIGSGVSSLGLSIVGIKQNYKALSLKDGLKRSVKDTYYLFKEMLVTKNLPQEEIVVLATTSHPMKSNDIIKGFSGKRPSKVKFLKVTEKPETTQLNIRGLNPNEDAYGSNYISIAKGKAQDYSTREILKSKITNTGSNLDGKTIEEAFPGRKILLATTDVGFEMPLNASKLNIFKKELVKEFKMTEKQADSFISGLDKMPDGKVDLLGRKTHRNLEALGKYLPDVKNKKYEAEVLLAKIMKKINLGGDIEFYSATAIRDVTGSKNSHVSLETTKCKITSKTPDPNMPFYEVDAPIRDLAEIVEASSKVSGIISSQAPREYLSTCKATEASYKMYNKNAVVHNFRLSSALIPSYYRNASSGPV